MKLDNLSIEQLDWIEDILQSIDIDVNKKGVIEHVYLNKKPFWDLTEKELADLVIKLDSI